jgi:hypothetical protein
MRGAARHPRRPEGCRVRASRLARECVRRGLLSADPPAAPHPDRAQPHPSAVLKFVATIAIVVAALLALLVFPF